MNAIIGMSVLALQLPLTRKLHNYIQTINQAGNSLLRIINDILDFSKIEAGKLEFEEQDFLLSAALDTIVAMFAEQVAAKGVELVVYHDNDVPLYLRGDALRLEQVLMNLVSNGLKFTDLGEVAVRVSCVEQTTDGVNLLFAVSDSGIGLTEEQQQQLFTSFHQADTSITRKYGGTGLGLAICKQLAEMMGGTIRVASQLGQGSTFFFTARFALQTKQHDVDESHSLPGHSERLLLVHANRVARAAWEYILLGQGFKVKTLPSVYDIPRPFPVDSYDLLVVDMGSEPEQKVESITRVRQETQLPLFLIMGATSGQLWDQLNALADITLLEKPLKQGALVEGVCLALGIIGQKAKRQRQEEIMLPDFHGLRVLVVEDNHINQQVVAEILRNGGCEVLVADHGKQAVDILAHEEVDAVFMDLQMPEMDGLEATRLLRADPRFRDLLIIAQTAHSIAEDREQCFAAGMNEFISKPIDQFELYRLLGHYFASSERQLDVSALAEESDHEPSMGKLAGLNLKEGLRRFNNQRSFYEKMLRDFSRQYSTVDIALRQAVRDDPAQARLLAHSIKGLAVNLAADELSAAAAVVEQALKAGQEVSSAQLDSFTVALATVVASIETIDGREEVIEPLSGQVTVATEAVLIALDDLLTMIKANDLDAEAAVQNLQSRLAGQGEMTSLLAQIREGIDGLDFQEIIPKVEKLRELVASELAA